MGAVDGYAKKGSFFAVWPLRIWKGEEEGLKIHNITQAERKTAERPSLPMA